jgi:hypothetical protein
MIKRRSYFVIAAVALLMAVGICLNAAPQVFFSNDLTLHETTTTSAGGRGGDRTVTVTNYLSGNAMKRSSSDGKDVIIRLDQEKLIDVNNPNKTYSEITFQQLQSLMDAASAALGQDKESAQAMPDALKRIMGGTGEIKVSKLGPGENIAGFATEKYLISGPWQFEIWTAPELKVPAAYYDAIKARMPRSPMFDFGKMYDEMKKMNGMAVKTIMTMKMMGVETKSTTVVTSVEKGAIPKSVFDVPAGYKKIDSSLK